MFTLPVYFGIALVVFVRYKSVLDDFVKCSTVVKKYKRRYAGEITDSLVRTLIVGEDHRNILHFGVDPIAMLRSIKVWVLEGKKQGASTIEQQLVRTIIGRYEKTLRRKIREQILAVMLSSKFTKDELATCYLKVAYYGASLVGVAGLKLLRNGSANYANEVIIAHLKYPRASVPDEVLFRKQFLRVLHLRRLLAGSKPGLFLNRSSRTLSDSSLGLD